MDGSLVFLFILLGVCIAAVLAMMIVGIIDEDKHPHKRAYKKTSGGSDATGAVAAVMMSDNSHSHSSGCCGGDTSGSDCGGGDCGGF